MKIVIADLVNYTFTTRADFVILQKLFQKNYYDKS